MRRFAGALCVFLVVLATLTAQSFAWTDESYRAAVVEFMPAVATTYHATRAQALNIMHQNADSYEVFVAKAKKSGVDIIVFPEYGLYGPNFPTRDSAFPYLESIPNGGANPCTEGDLYPTLNITKRYVELCSSKLKNSTSNFAVVGHAVSPFLSTESPAASC